MDNKIADMKKCQKNNELVEEIEDFNMGGREGQMQDLSTELIQLKALSKSILQLSPDSDARNQNNSLQNLENGLSPVPMEPYYNPYQNSYIEPMLQPEKEGYPFDNL